MNAKTLFAALSGTIVLAALSAPSAQAVDFGISRDKNCVGGTGASSCSLQNIVNHLTTAGPTLDTTQDSGVQAFTTAGNSATSSYLFSVAGFAPHNTFGIYKIGDPSTKVQLFGGVTSGITAGAQTAVNFLANGAVQVGDTVVQGFGQQFGFYLHRTNKDPLTVYSQNHLNVAGAQQVVSYQGNGSTQFTIGGQTQLFDKNTFLLGFEDLRLAASDKDYNDLAVLVSGIRDSKDVPEPTALLSLAAIGGATVLRRRMKMA